MASKASKSQIQFDRNPIEAVRDASVDVVKGVGSAVRHDLIEQSISDAWKQLLGSDKPREMVQDDMYFGAKEGPLSKGDLQEGQEIIFTKKEKINAEPGIDYVREVIHAEKRIGNEQNRELATKIEKIAIELKKLSSSSKELQVTFKDVTMEIIPVKPGKYHLNFFEWMLVTIQNARMRIEDSAAWIGVVSRKKNKKDYWSLSKKHGTSYMLSGERVVAQQVG